MAMTLFSIQEIYRACLFAGTIPKWKDPELERIKPLSPYLEYGLYDARKRRGHRGSTGHLADLILYNFSLKDEEQHYYFYEIDKNGEQHDTRRDKQDITKEETSR